jgi:hypothetical protein
MARPEDIITAQSVTPSLAMKVADLAVDLGHCGYPHADVYIESALASVAEAQAYLAQIERVLTAEAARRKLKVA